MAVFISYRRGGSSEETAKTIYEELSGEYEVFLDKESLGGGRFAPEIERQIRECDDYLLIIEKTTFDRCNEPGDWILHEAGIVREYEKNIIPVFVDGNSYKDKAPDELRFVYEYNGIKWTEEDPVVRLKRLLVSCRKYDLYVDYDHHWFTLTEGSVEVLKEICRKFTEHYRVKTPVNVHFNNIEGIVAGEMMTPDKAENKDQFLAYTKQTDDYRRMLKRMEKKLAYAIEIMLMDRFLDKYAHDLCAEYAEKYGVDKCYFIDSEGDRQPYWTVFLWVRIIEQMLKNCTPFGMDNEYHNEYYLHLEAILYNANLCFKTHVEIDPDDPQFVLFAGSLDYYQMPRASLLTIVYPDFFFYLGEKKAEDPDRFNIVSQYPGALRLDSYGFAPA